MNFRERFIQQFHQPKGLPGWLAGVVMAHRPSNRKRNLWATSLLDVRPDDRVLEIGFGPGFAVTRMARLIGSGRIVGVDHSETMHEQASRRNARAIRDGRVELQVRGFESIDTMEGAFDKVLAVNSAMFWTERVVRLRAIRSIMRAGGTIAIAHQPRVKGASDSMAAREVARLSEELVAAGFRASRTDTLDIKPVAVVCVRAEA